MREHTAGPWQMQSVGDGYEVYKPNAIGSVGEIIAYVPTDDNGQDYIDARLITASPDLLSVAKSVVYVHENSGTNAQFILRGLVDDARAAIAKALS